MSSIAPIASLQLQLGATLAQRQVELRTLLAAASPTAADHLPEVQDFKDAAAEESRAVVDEVTHAHARQELAQVAAALRRIAEGHYGLCQDCGESIDARRLCALPATPYCTACQSIHERPRGARR